MRARKLQSTQLTAIGSWPGAATEAAAVWPATRCCLWPAHASSSPPPTPGGLSDGGTPQTGLAPTQQLPAGASMASGQRASTACIEPVVPTDRKRTSKCSAWVAPERATATQAAGSARLSGGPGGGGSTNSTRGAARREWAQRLTAAAEKGALCDCSSAVTPWARACSA